MARRAKRDENRITLEERLGPDVLLRLESMAGEFVRFERGQFGFYIDPARYAVKQRQVGPLGRGRRRKVVAGVDKDGNIITAWIGVDGKDKGAKAGGGELVSIPDGYAEGMGAGKGGGKGGKGGKGKGPGGGGGDGDGGDGDGSGGGGGSGGSGGSGGGGGGSGSGGKGGGGEGEGTDSGEGAGTGKGTGDGSGQGDRTDGTGEGKKKADPSAPPSAAEVAKQAAEKRAAVGIAGSSAAASKTEEKKDNPDPNTPAIPKPPIGNLQAKNNEARGRKKKPLHWAKVPKNLLKDSVWMTLQDGSISLPEEEIDELFGVDIAPQFLVEAAEAKPEVLPHKRKHNINIILANLKMTAEQIKDVVRIPTYSSLEVAKLNALLSVCPTAEEEQLLIQSANLKDQVDKTDQFMMELAEMPGLHGKISCGLAAKTFNEEAVEVIRNMDLFAMIAVEIQNSVKLNKILEIILALGNFLNSGTGRGGAHGFKLEALAMLSTVKDSKGDSLLDYLVSILRKDFPSTVPINDMPTLERSNTVSLDGIGEQVQTILDSVNNVNDQIKKMGDDPTLVNFKNEMVAFSEEAVKVREEIVSLRALMMDKLQSMMAHFGERNKAARGRQEDILRMLREFCEELQGGFQRAEEKEERMNKKNAKAKKNEDASMALSGVEVSAPVEKQQSTGQPPVSVQVSSASQAVSGSKEPSPGKDPLVD